MKLSDVDIKKRLKDGDLIVTSLNDTISFDAHEQIQPASIDLTLGGELRSYEESEEPIDVMDPDEPEIIQTGDELVIEPQQFALAYTNETLNVPNDLAAEIKGRSSIGRLGLHIHTAGWADPKFTGQITLELVNHLPRPLKLHSGMRICQVVYDELKTPCEVGYADKDDAKYSGQSAVTPSRIGDDFN